MERQFTLLNPLHPCLPLLVGGSLARVISREVRRQGGRALCAAAQSPQPPSPEPEWEVGRGKGKQSTQHKEYLVFAVKIARLFSP